MPAPPAPPAPPNQSSDPPRRRRGRLIGASLAAAAVLALGAGALAAGPAEAQLTVGPAPTPTVLPPTTHDCQTILRCPVSTTVTFDHVGLYLWVESNFPAGATGTVDYRLHCSGGLTKTWSAPIATWVDREALTKPRPYDEQHCTVTQTVLSGYTTSTSTSVPRPDDEWPEEIVTFYNRNS